MSGVYSVGDIFENTSVSAMSIKFLMDYVEVQLYCSLLFV